jgi:hypothetical protein
MSNRRAALLVGINQYWFSGWSPLLQARADCDKLKAALSLTPFGFHPADVHTVTTPAAGGVPDQPCRNNLLYDGLFTRFSATFLDLFVFFFAGHGVEHEQRSYLVPADGVVDRVPETCLSFTAILDRLMRVPARQRLVILDACHGGGARSTGTGLPPSFAEEAKRIHETVVLSSCSTGEHSHEDDRDGGIFTHYWCEKLHEQKQPAPGAALTVFDVQEYAARKVGTWAQKRGVQQSPRIFCANCPTVHLLPRQEEPVPAFLNDVRSRTENIVRALDELLRRPDEVPAHPIRIRGRMSSFAIADREVDLPSTDQALHALLLSERNRLIDLLHLGATFRVILSWNVDEWLPQPGVNLAKIEARIEQLLAFFQKLLAADAQVARFAAIRVPVPERNYLFLGSDYLFVGRKLRVGSGFDATEMVTEAGPIQREIQMFDSLFEDGRGYMANQRGVPDGGKDNRALLERLCRDLDDDLARLRRPTPRPRSPRKRAT